MTMFLKICNNDEKSCNAITAELGKFRYLITLSSPLERTILPLGLNEP